MAGVVAPHDAVVEAEEEDSVGRDETRYLYGPRPLLLVLALDLD